MYFERRIASQNAMYYKVYFDVMPGLSGPARYVSSIANSMTEWGFEPVYGVAQPAFKPSVEADLRANDFAVTKSRVPSGIKATLPRPVKVAVGFHRKSRQLAREIECVECSIFHTQHTGCEEAPVAARLAKHPRVLGTFHVDSTYDLENARGGLIYRALERLSNRCLHRAIAVSEATKRDWVRRTGIPADRVVTIHNGVDAHHFQRGRSQAAARQELGLPNDGRLIVGGVGRLDAAKGFAYLIEAAAMLAADFPQLHLAIAGQGGLREELEELARRFGVANRVQFLGQCADVRIVYDALDVYAMPSLCEALPYALLEAIAHELPVAAATVGGIPEVIVEGETGFLTPPRDATALAAALRSLIESQDLRLRLGRAGRERVSRHFTEADCVQKTIDVYRQMLGGATTAASPR